MKGLDGGFIFNGGKNIVDRYGRTEMEPRRTVEEPRWEDVFHVSEIRGRGDYSEGRIVRLESSGKILRAY